MGLDSKKIEKKSNIRKNLLNVLAGLNIRYEELFSGVKKPLCCKSSQKNRLE